MGQGHVLSPPRGSWGQRSVLLPPAALGHGDVVPSIAPASSCSRQKQPLQHGGQAGRSQAGAGLPKSGPPLHHLLLLSEPFFPPVTPYCPGMLSAASCCPPLAMLPPPRCPPQVPAAGWGQEGPHRPRPRCAPQHLPAPPASSRRPPAPSISSISPLPFLSPFFPPMGVHFCASISSCVRTLPPGKASPGGAGDPFWGGGRSRAISWDMGGTHEAGADALALFAPRRVHAHPHPTETAGHAEEAQ